MILRRYMSSASVACGLTLAFTGSAMAADVTIGTTGAGSDQTVKVDNTSYVNLSNTNVVQVVNENVQTATTGDVNASKNTTIGGEVASGDATNANATTTSVSIANPVTGVLSDGSEGLPGGSGEGATGTNGGTPTGTTAGTGKVLGASTAGGLGGSAILPVTGASVPVDVTALRAAFGQAGNVPTATIAKQSRAFSGAMLAVATLLSLIGAALSAVYAKRREERV